MRYFSYQPILLQPGVSALRTEFGSLDQRITNIVYTNGALDPWLYTGMTYTFDEGASVITIPRKLSLPVIPTKTFL